MNEFAVRYYYYRYLAPSERKQYIRKVDLKTDKNRLRKILYIKEIIATLKRVKSVERVADMEGKKSNTMWVYLKRNKDIVEGIVGMPYHTFLESIRFNHHVDMESFLEASVQAKEDGYKDGS